MDRTGGNILTMRDMPGTLSVRVPKAAFTAYENLSQQSREQQLSLPFVEFGAPLLTYKKIGVPKKQELYPESADRKKGTKRAMNSATCKLICLLLMFILCLYIKIICNTVFHP